MFDIHNKPNSDGIVKGVSGNYEQFSQIINELVDNSISNYRAHEDEAGFLPVIDITVTEYDKTVEVFVKDNGTGLRNLDADLTLAGAGCAETVLNEHGFGLKTALSSVDSWTIYTCTKEDVKLGQHKKIFGPYSFEKFKGWLCEGECPDCFCPGTTVRFTCSKAMFQTLKPANRRAKDGFWALIKYLREELGYTYAKVLADREVAISVKGISGDSEDEKEVEPVMPRWEKRIKLPTVKTDLGGGVVEVDCEYGTIIPCRKNAKYYKANLTSSGVEIRVNGRVIECGLYSRIWNEAPHPSQNRFLAQVCITTDKASALPVTHSSKNGFRKGDEKLEALYSWIRKNIQKPEKNNQSLEHRLVACLAAKMEQQPGVLRVSMEEGAYTSIGSKSRIDLFVSAEEKAVIYEAKAHTTRAENLYQLMLYWDGCSMDGKPVDEAVLIAERHPSEVFMLLDQLNSQKDPTGRPYHFRVTTWTEEGVSLPATCA